MHGFVGDIEIAQQLAEVGVILLMFGVGLHFQLKDLLAVKNVAIPVVTIMGLQFGTLLGGAVVTETVFSWPGIGLLAIKSIGSRDYPIVQSAVLLVAIAFVFVNFLVDLAYGWLDPRIRYA